jgi:hypothetical protein
MLPRINLNDGKHKMVVAEAGERILSPEENEQYESTHPGARQKPMKADVYDMGGFIGKAFGKGETDQDTIKKGADSIQGVPAGKYLPQANALSGYNDAFDKGGAVQTPLGNRIADRANELYTQAKALHAPENSEAASFKDKQANIDAYKNSLAPAANTGMRPYAPAAVDKVNPAAKTRPEEKRIDPRELQDMQKPLGSVPVYDDGGTVPTDDDRLKEAAQRQAEDEVMNNAPLGHGDLQKREAATDISMRRYPSPEKPVSLQYDTEKPVDASKTEHGEGASMNTDNAPLGSPKMEEHNAKPAEPSPMMSEASAKTPLGPKVAAPQGTGMKQFPGTPGAEQAQNEATSRVAGYPVQHEEPASDPMAIVQQDKMEAMKKGTAGLTDLGTSLIHEKALMPKYTGPGENKMTQGEQIPEGQLGKDEKQYGQQQSHQAFEDKRKDYDRRIQEAMDLGTPEGDREAASLHLAKQNFEKMNPYGSAANHPGILGKIEHGLAKAGNIAGDIVAPGTMENIPGTELNKMSMEDRYHAQEAESSKQALEAAQAKKMKQGEWKPETGMVEYDAAGKPIKQLFTNEPSGQQDWRAIPDAAGAPAAGATTTVPAAGAPAAGASDQGNYYGAKEAVNRPMGEREASQHTEQVAAATARLPQGVKLAEPKFTNDDTMATAKEKVLQYNHDVNTAVADAVHVKQLDEAEDKKIAAEDRKQDKVDKRAYGLAEDAEGRVMYTNKYDADRNAEQGTGGTFEPMGPGQLANERNSLKQLGDVQMNVSDYTSAARKYDDAKLTPQQQASDSDNFARIMNKTGWYAIEASISAGGHIDVPVLSAYAEAMSTQKKSEQYNALSPQGKEMYNSYTRTMAAVPLYMRAASGISRVNKEVIDLELGTIANPTMGTTAILDRQAMFQKNIDRISNALPRNLPGLKHPSEVKQTVENPHVDAGHVVVQNGQNFVIDETDKDGKATKWHKQ